MREICAVEGMPDEAAVRAWALDNVNGFGPHYLRARKLGYLRMAEEVLIIADTPHMGERTTIKSEPLLTDLGANVYDAAGNPVVILKKETVYVDMVDHRRLQVETRKWMLAKVLPKIFGDKLALTGDGGGPVEFKQIERRIVDPQLVSEAVVKRVSVNKSEEPPQ